MYLFIIWKKNNFFNDYINTRKFYLISIIGMFLLGYLLMNNLAVTFRIGCHWESEAGHLCISSGQDPRGQVWVSKPHTSLRKMLTAVTTRRRNLRVSFVPAISSQMVYPAWTIIISKSVLGFSTQPLIAN